MAINSGKWTGLGDWDVDNETEARRIMDEYYKKMAEAQKNAAGQGSGWTQGVSSGLYPSMPPYSPNGTTSTIIAPTVKDDGYYKKVAEEMQKSMAEKDRQLRELFDKLNKVVGRATKAELELESYKGLIPWLLMNHPELLEEFNVVVKAKARLEMES